jgi:hypothetical protein
LRKKIVGIFVCTLLIATAIPAVGTMNTTTYKKYNLQYANSIEWNLTYGGDEFDAIRCVDQTSDEGFICCGLTEESDNFYVYLLKLDSEGNEEWNVVKTNLNGTYVDPYDNEVFVTRVLQTSDGGYLLCGWSMDYIDEPGAYFWVGAGFICKTNSSGVTEWIKHYWSLEEQAIDIIECPLELSDNSGYIASGIRYYYDEEAQITDLNGTLLQVDLDGEIVWQEFYHVGEEDAICSLSTTSDNGYIMSGCVFSDDLNDGALWMIKTDDEGGETWSQIFDGPTWEYSYVRDCFETPDGGFIMCGTSNSYSPTGDYVDAWVIKTDSSGNEEWNRTYGGKQNDYTWAMEEVDGGYVIAITDNFDSVGGTKDDILLVKVKEDGLTEWSYLIEEEGRQIPTTIRQTEDDGYIISGRTDAIGDPNSDGILYKLSSIKNNPPDKPKGSGKTKVDPGKSYTYKASTTDPDGDQVYYMWDWGDGNFSEWLGPYDSGEESETENFWNKGGTYTIKVRAKDEHGGESEWVNPKIKNKPFNVNPFIVRILQQHPRMFPILRLILGM